MTKAASGWDTETVKRSLNVLSETIDQTYPHLSAALDGVARFSDTIGKRDDEIQGAAGQRQQDRRRPREPQRADQRAADQRADPARRGQRAQLRGQHAAGAGRSVLGRRSRASSTTTRTSTTCWSSCAPISDILKERKYDLVDVLSTLSKFTASLAEAIASGPYFKVLLVNLLPPWLLQPFVDSAFKKRGIDPEEFWRNAGLPVVAVPRSERHAIPERCSGAGPRGAGRHPGPSRTRGGRRPPVLVHADARDAAAARRSAAVLAPVDRPVRAEPVRRRTVLQCPPDVVTSPPNPNGPASHRASRRGHPGSAAAGYARCAGTAAARTAGARTVPLRPAAAGRAGLHAGHRTAAAGADRSTAAAGTRSGRGSGRNPASAGQPAVPSTWVAEG